MSRRTPSVTNVDSGVSRFLESNLAAVLAVAAKLDTINLAVDLDFDFLESALDFTGITVVSGSEAAWNPDTKVLTVPTVKGDKGDDAEPLTINVTNNGNGTYTWTFSDGSVFTTGNLRGAKGDKGDKGDNGDALTILTASSTPDNRMFLQFSDGTEYISMPLVSIKGDTGAPGPKGEKGDDLTIEQIVTNGNGTFTFQFSDGTAFTTPSLIGPQGIQGIQGPQGDDGVGVHHIKGTRTTDPHGDFGTFGELDTYTFYADADEKQPLGSFKVRNGVSSFDDAEALGLMTRRIYDVNGDGIVDNSERLGGATLADVQGMISAAAASLGTVFLVSSLADLNDIEEISVGDLAIVKDGADWSAYIVDEVLPAVLTSPFTDSIAQARADSFTALTTRANTFPSAINELDAEVEELQAALGDISLLDTVVTTDLVSAVNALQAGVGDVALLSEGTNTVEAIESIRTDMGYVSTLDTPADTLTAAINQITASIGDVSTLSTSADTLTRAINEVLAAVSLLVSEVGSVSNLTTASKIVVGAINELNAAKFDKTGGLISGDVAIAGGLFVSGETTTVSTVALTVSDSIITLNKDEAGPGVTSRSSGIIIDRGTLSDYLFVFDEVTDTFRIGIAGDLQAVATRDDVITHGSIMVWDNTNKKLIGKTITEVNGVATTDPRLSDARDWDAAEVSKVAAEEGVETISRKWSALRVRQAILAWWATVTSAFTRTFLTSTDAESARATLGLTASATKEIGTVTGTLAAGDDTRIVNAVQTSGLGAASGVATLDSAGKIPMSQIPDAALGKVDYRGTWNAGTNTPTLTLVPEVKGHYYVVDVAGVFDGVDYEPKDIIISNGNSWDKIDNTDNVISVNGHRGIINLSKSDIGLSAVDNTADVDKSVLSASKLTSNKTIKLTGKVTGTVTTDLSDTVTIETTVAEKGLAGGLATLDQTGKLTETELPFKVDDSVESNTDTWSSNKVKDYADSTAVTNAIVFAIALG